MDYLAMHMDESDVMRELRNELRDKEERITSLKVAEKNLRDRGSDEAATARLLRERFEQRCEWLKQRLQELTSQDLERRREQAQAGKASSTLQR